MKYFQIIFIMFMTAQVFGSEYSLINQENDDRIELSCPDEKCQFIRIEYYSSTKEGFSFESRFDVYQAQLFTRHLHSIFRNRQIKNLSDSSQETISNARSKAKRIDEKASVAIVDWGNALVTNNILAGIDMIGRIGLLIFDKDYKLKNPLIQNILGNRRSLKVSADLNYSNQINSNQFEETLQHIQKNRSYLACLSKTEVKKQKHFLKRAIEKKCLGLSD